MNQGEAETNKLLYDLLYHQFGKAILSKREASIATGFSPSSLDRMRKAGIGPEYKKMPGKNNYGSVYYPLPGIVKFIINGNIRTA